ncbi:MAG: O-antigen ligase domain-containing protein [Bacteroidetes bacterium]|nr:MAG: O-antigen ligase domain-containing protein [Bacteroidota bacterium]
MNGLLKIWQDKDQKVFPIIFLLWMITLPFGSYLIGLNVGLFTIYPAFVFLVVLFLKFIFHYPKWHIGLRAFSFFLLLWLLFGILSKNWIEPQGLAEWKFDIKSLIMQFVTVSVLFGAFHSFGKERFNSYFNTGLITFLVILIISGLYEFYTGNHILGHFTDKMLLEAEIRPFFYAPTFVYDNPNDYLVYFNAVLVLLVFQFRKSRQYAWIFLTIAMLGLIFGITANARIMILVDVAIILWVLARTFISYFDQFKLALFWPIPVAVLLLAILFLRSDMFYGPKYVQGNYTTDGTYELFPAPYTGKTSTDIRLNLTKNGLEFIKEKPLTGIGAGQFRYRHSVKKVVNDTGTVHGPHNYFIEIISQYGIVAWLFLLFLFVGFAGSFSRFWQSKSNYYHILILFGLYPLFCVVPSGFLYMDINWLFVAFLMMYSFATPFEQN